MSGVTVLAVYRPKPGKAAAIDAAHGNPAVIAMWGEFGAACDYLPIADLPGAKEMFSPFTRVTS
jgi:hypothetical protein